MTEQEIERRVQLTEARQALRWAAQRLTDHERAALEGLALGKPEREIATECGKSRQAVDLWKRTGAEKMRRRLAILGIHRTADLLTPERVPAEMLVVERL